MNLALLLLLALLWSVVLVPTALRNRQRSLHHSMGGFSRAMEVLGAADGARGRDQRMVLVPSNPARIVEPPRGAALARERRRRALARLLVATGATGSLALLVGGVFVQLFVLSAVGLGVFIAALRRMAVERARARALVDLDQHRGGGARTADADRHAVGI